MFNSNVQGLNPFYLFQLYTVVLWSLQYYWKFAVIIAVTSVISVTVSVWETRRVRLFIICFFYIRVESLKPSLIQPLFNWKYNLPVCPSVSRFVGWTVCCYV